MLRFSKKNSLQIEFLVIDAYSVADEIFNAERLERGPASERVANFHANHKGHGRSSTRPAARAVKCVSLLSALIGPEREK